MVDYTKDQLKAVNKELREKLKEMKSVEQQVTADAKDLSHYSIGVHKDEKGNYSLVHVKYDVEKNVAVIEKVESLDTFDFAIANYKAKDFLVERILRKARGDKYAE